jgi:mono/diheme cytochrome c family protein
MESNSKYPRISNPEIRNLKSDSADLAAQAKSNLRFRISGFEILESSNFKISLLLFISILFLLLLTLLTYAQDATRTVWDGVYNEEQARRGQAAFLNQCANCHGRDLEGADMTPALTGGAFTANWDGLTIGDLADRIRISMPLNSPGTLSRQQTTDVIAYILQFNQFPAGKEELPREQPAQKQILFKARP